MSIIKYRTSTEFIAFLAKCNFQCFTGDAFPVTSERTNSEFVQLVSQKISIAREPADATSETERFKNVQLHPTYPGYPPQTTQNPPSVGAA